MSDPDKNPKRRLLICEEALKNFNGHWYEYNKAVVEINEAIGTEVTVLGHRELSSEITEELPAHPYFESTNWDGIYYHPNALRRYIGILHHNRRVYRAISRHLRNEKVSYDCVFVPTVVIFHLLAWWFLARKFGGTKVKRLVLLIRNSATTYENEEEVIFSQSAKILGFVLKQFRRFTDSGLVTFSTDSHRLAAEYRQLAGIEMTVLPHPCCLTDALSSNTDQSQPNSSFTIVSPGPARWEKGTQLLLTALRTIDSLDIRCRIQWPDSVLDPEGNELMPKSAQCEFLTEPLSSEDYKTLLAGADCIVLPYLREAYYARISGVAVEAMLLGIPIIYTDDTWVADVVSQYGAGLGFPSGDVSALAKRIEVIAKNPEKWRTEATSRIDAARSHFSSSNFQDGLWGAKEQVR